METKNQIVGLLYMVINLTPPICDGFIKYRSCHIVPITVEGGENIKNHAVARL